MGTQYISVFFIRPFCRLIIRGTSLRNAQTPKKNVKVYRDAKKVQTRLVYRALGMYVEV